MRFAALIVLLIAAQADAATLEFERDALNERNGWSVKYYAVYRPVRGGRLFVTKIKATARLRYSLQVEPGCYFVTSWATLRAETEMRESHASLTRCTN